MNVLSASGLRNAFDRARQGGFTLIELLVTVMIVLALASVALPMTELASQRDKEQQLRRSLREIREALDAYKQAGDDGKIARKALDSGYPPSLEALTDGVPDARSTTGAKFYFIRRIPRDPFFVDPDVPAASTWGRRSYASSGDEPKAGSDVYDVYSTSTAIGMNGIPYREW